MKRKTICFVINGLGSGGAERVVSTLSNFLVTNNNIVIITLKKSSSFYPLNPNIKTDYCLESIEPSNNIIQAFKTNYRLFKRLRKHLTIYKPDICFGFMTTSNILSTLAARNCKIPVVICERNNPVMEDMKLSRIWIILRKYVYPKANLLVVQTTKIKDFFTPNCNESKIRIIANPVNPKFNKDSKGNKENVILNVGRLNRQKAQHILIKTFAKLNLVDWKLVILGEGTERNRLQELIDRLGMTDRISLVGSVENVEYYYKTSSIFAFTSIYEGFPNALLEAMYFGLPCVSTDCPTGPSELIQDGENGYLIPLNSIRELTEKLHKLVNDSSIRKKLGEQAAITTQEYSLNNIIKNWESIIYELS